jgi:hypothetical protein
MQTDQPGGDTGKLTVQRLVDAFGEGARPYIPLAIDITKAHAEATGESLASVGVDILVTDVGSLVIRGRLLLCTGTLERFRGEIPCFDKECVNVACNMVDETTTYTLVRGGDEDKHYYYGERARSAGLHGGGPVRHHGKAKHSRLALRHVAKSMPAGMPESARAVVECYVTSVDRVPRFTVFGECTTGVGDRPVYRVSISGVTQCDASLLSVLVVGTGHKVVGARAHKHNCVGTIECDLLEPPPHPNGSKPTTKKKAWYARLLG